MKVAAASMFAVFVLCAALQYNDPDPLVWVPIYLFPAVLAALAFRGRLLVAVPLLGAIAYVLAAAWYAPPYAPGYLDDEGAREAGGLLLSGLWMAAQAAFARAGRRRLSIPGARG